MITKLIEVLIDQVKTVLTELVRMGGKRSFICLIALALSGYCVWVVHYPPANWVKVDSLLNLLYHLKSWIALTALGIICFVAAGTWISAFRKHWAVSISALLIGFGCVFVWDAVKDYRGLSRQELSLAAARFEKRERAEDLDASAARDQIVGILRKTESEAGGPFTVMRVPLTIDFETISFQQPSERATKLCRVVDAHLMLWGTVRKSDKSEDTLIQAHLDLAKDLRDALRDGVNDYKTREVFPVFESGEPTKLAKEIRVAADALFHAYRNQNDAALRILCQSHDKSALAMSGLLLHKLTAKEERIAETLELAIENYDKALGNHADEAPDKKDKFAWDVWLNRAGAFKLLAMTKRGQSRLELLNRARRDFEDAERVLKPNKSSELWTFIKMNLGHVLTALSDMSQGEIAQKLLDETERAYGEAAEVYAKIGLSKQEAVALTNHASALKKKAELPISQRPTDLLRRSVEISGEALEIAGRSVAQVAITRNNLGNTLIELGKRERPDKAIADLKKAIYELEQASDLRKKNGHPRYVASTQQNLGAAYRELAKRVSGETVEKLLEKSVEVLDKAQAVYRLDSSPKQWVDTQIIRAETLISQGIRLRGSESLEKLHEAERALCNALNEEPPLTTWATIQQQRGSVLRHLGLRRSGREAINELKKSQDAFTSALRVRSNQKSEKFAETKNSLGITLRHLGKRTIGPEGVAYLKESVAAFKKAASIYEELALPQQWAATMNNLGVALLELTERSPGFEGDGYLNNALAAFKESMRVRKPDLLPQQWALTQCNLAKARVEEGRRLARREQRDQAKEVLNTALHLLNEVTVVRNDGTLPQQWAITQRNRAIALHELSKVVSSPRERIEVLTEAVQRLDQALEVFDKTNFAYQHEEIVERRKKAAEEKVRYEQVA